VGRRAPPRKLSALVACSRPASNVLKLLRAGDALIQQAAASCAMDVLSMVGVAEPDLHGRIGQSSEILREQANSCPESFSMEPLVLERLEPTAEEIEQFYLAGIDDDVAQGFIYASPQDVNPTVPKKAKKRKLRSTAHVDKLPKKVKETLVEKETVKKSLPVKKTTRSQKSSTIKKRTRLQMADDDEPRLQMADDDEPMFSPRRRSPPRRPSPPPQPKQQVDCYFSVVLQCEN
ncbi:hypothetical protein Dimus_011399, partial [Dionaea muscipula]